MLALAAEQVFTNSNAVVYLLGALLGGSAITGIFGYLRFKKIGRAEKEEIISKAAEKAVVSLQASLSRLEAELERVKEERDRLERNLSDSIAERAVLSDKVTNLAARVQELEFQVHDYKKEIEILNAFRKSPSQVQ